MSISTLMSAKKSLELHFKVYQNKIKGLLDHFQVL